MTARRVNDVSSIPVFNQPTGPSVDMSNKTPLDFFKLLVTDTMLDGIVEQTNSSWMPPPSLPPHSRVHGWSKEAHTRPELKKFLAMIVTMGLVNLYRVLNVWTGRKKVMTDSTRGLEYLHEGNPPIVHQDIKS